MNANFWYMVYIIFDILYIHYNIFNYRLTSRACDAKSFDLCARTIVSYHCFTRLSCTAHHWTICNHAIIGNHVNTAVHSRIAIVIFIQVIDESLYIDSLIQNCSVVSYLGNISHCILSHHQVCSFHQMKPASLLLTWLLSKIALSVSTNHIFRC